MMPEPNDDEGINVFAIARDEHVADSEPIGKAMTRSMAAKMMRKFLSERDGDPYTELTAKSIYFSTKLNAYFIEE